MRCLETLEKVLPGAALKLWNGICANNIIFVVVYKIVRSALRSVVQNSPKCPACMFFLTKLLKGKKKFLEEFGISRVVHGGGH